MTDPFHLAWFLNGTSAPAWGRPWSGHVGRDWMQPDLFVDLARGMERAAFDFLLIEDNAFVGDRYGDSMELYLRHALQAPRQDPVVLATLLTQVTNRLGIIPTISTFAYHPYLVARMIGSLDQISRGRVGANIVTGTSDRAVQNYGQDGMAEHDARYEEAEEFLAACTALWGTWEPGALTADHATGVFADHTKVHRADFAGERYRSRGPLVSGPLTDGRPVVSQAGGSPRGRAFAAAHADTIIAIEADPAAMKAYREDVHARAVETGRKPGEIKVLFGIWPTVAASQAEADERLAEKVAYAEANVEIELARMAKSTDIDFAQVPLDVPLGQLDLATNGTQQFAKFAARNAERTLREAAVAKAGAAGPVVAGTPDSVASQLAEIMDEVGGDGFLIGTDGVTRRLIAEITDGLVPELSRRGLTRDGYSRTTLRDHLLEF